VIARGVDRRRIFVDDEDYETYVGLLAAVVKRQGWHLLAYCLMPNHVHLLIETPTTNLGNGIQWLHGRYASAFNRRHGRKGHLFETRYLSPFVADEEAVARTAAYIVANPLAASLSRSAGDWPWGSHAQVMRGDHVPAWIAHDRLQEHLGASSGFSSYPDLIAAREQLCWEEIGQRRQRSRSFSLSQPAACLDGGALLG
jgi:REP element-mobilizing transposase RayT